MTYNTYNVQWLLNKVGRKENVKYLLFWGHTPSKDGTVTKSCLVNGGIVHLLWRE